LDYNLEVFGNDCFFHFEVVLAGRKNYFALIPIFSISKVQRQR
jgi:hypothetical protein